jgi:hypothetical protein
VHRALAIVIAAGLVAGAILVRRALDDDNGGVAAGGGRPLVVCVTELKSVCDQLAEDGEVDATTESAGTTAEALKRDEGYLDAWLTIQPWPAIVADGGPTLDASGPLARSRIVVAVDRRREATLARHCQQEVTWRCIGDVAGGPWEEFGGDGSWGAVKVGYADPTEAGVGPAIIGQAAAGYFGDKPFAGNDLGEDAFLTWFSRLEREASRSEPRTGSYVEDLVTLPGTFDVVAGLSTDAQSARNRAVVLNVSPRASVDVVVAVPPGGDRDLEEVVSDAAKEVLGDKGWRVTVAELTGDDGLPQPGVLVALRNVSEEVR